MNQQVSLLLSSLTEEMRMLSRERKAEPHKRKAFEAPQQSQKNSLREEILFVEIVSSHKISNNRLRFYTN